MSEGTPSLPPSRKREGSELGARCRLGRPTAEVRELRNNATPHEAMLWRQLLTSSMDGVLETIAAAALGIKRGPTPYHLPPAGGGEERE